MLHYIKCPSCSRILAYNLDKFQQDAKKIQNDNTLNYREKDKLHSELLDKYGYKMICCRSRIKGLLPYHEIVIT